MPTDAGDGATFNAVITRGKEFDPVALNAGDHAIPDDVSVGGPGDTPDDVLSIEHDPPSARAGDLDSLDHHIVPTIKVESIAGGSEWPSSDHGHVPYRDPVGGPHVEGLRVG